MIPLKVTNSDYMASLCGWWYSSTATYWMKNIFHRGILGWITAPGEFKGDLEQSSPIESPRPLLKKSGRISALTSTRWELPSIRWILISKVGVGNVASLEEAAKDLQTLRVVSWRIMNKSLLKGYESVWSSYENIHQKPQLRGKPPKKWRPV